MKILLFILSILLIISCDAPRENPLDPNGDNYKFYSIQGYVKTQTGPPQPIENAIVTWGADAKITYTNTEGYFRIDNVNPVNDYLIVEKSGFLKDSNYINWDRRNISVEYFLNSIPELTEFNIYSEYENNYTLNPRTRIFFEAVVNDREGDLDSLYIANEDLKIKKLLERKTFSLFDASFSQVSLGINSLEELIGKEFHLIALDKSGKEYSIGNSNLKRVIRQEIEFISPATLLDTVSTQPNLRWRRFQPGFKFEYTVRVFENLTPPELRWERSGISSDSISVKVNVPLQPNTTQGYYWVVWCVDEFNNKGSSKPASFRVK